ncbi:hypothetical protein SH449x_002062 [Pirellulaceae bacterium SH449]
MQLVLKAFDAAIPRAASDGHAEEVLEIATHLRADRRYRLLPFGLTDLSSVVPRSKSSSRGGSPLSLLGCSGLGISSHIGAGRSPPQVR